MSDDKKNMEKENINKQSWWKNVGFKTNIQSLSVKLKNIILLLLVIIIPLISIIEYDININNSEIVFKIGYFLNEVKDNVQFSFNRFLKEKIYNIKTSEIKTTDKKRLVIPPDLSAEKKSIKNFYNNNKTNKEIIFKHFANTVYWTNKKIKTNFKHYHPIGIKIDNERYFICEEKNSEIYNHKLGKYFPLNNVPYLGKNYYQYKNGNILFINDKNIVLFDKDTQQFKILHNGIKDLHNSYSYSYKNILFPYSDDVIYIAVAEIGFDDHNGNLKYYRPEYLIKIYLNTFNYEKINIKNSPKFSSYSVINNKELLFTYRKNSDIQIYNAEKNEFSKLCETKLKGNFDIFKFGNDKVLLIPIDYKKGKKVISGTPLQLLDLKNMQTSLLNIPLGNFSDIYSNQRTENVNIIVFADGSILNTDNKNLYIPKNKYDFNNYYSLIIPLNDKNYMVLGSNGPSSEFSHNNSEIYHIKKFNDNEFIFTSSKIDNKDTNI